MCGSKCDAPSYSTMYERVHGREEPPKVTNVKESVEDSLRAMFSMFKSKEVKNDEIV